MVADMLLLPRVSTLILDQEGTSSVLKLSRAGSANHDVPPSVEPYISASVGTAPTREPGQVCRIDSKDTKPRLPAA
jgi:hypothetical protein